MEHFGLIDGDFIEYSMSVSDQNLNSTMRITSLNITDESHDVRDGAGHKWADVHLIVEGACQ